MVPGDAQGASGRWVQRLPESHIFYIGSLDMIRELHPLPIQRNLLNFQTAEVSSASKCFLGVMKMKVKRLPEFTQQRCLFDDKEVTHVRGKNTRCSSSE